MDQAVIALRFAVYANLLILFGLAAYPVYAPLHTGAGEAGGSRWRIPLLAGAAMALCAMAFALTATEMAGSGPAALEPEMGQFILFETAAGLSFLVRLCALAGAAVVAAPWFPAARSPRVLLPLLTGVAVVSLAWSGHAAAGSWFHRLADGVHLLAAGAWLGALVHLGRLVFGAGRDPCYLQAAEAAMRGFASAGTLLVAAILVTGAVNLLSIVGPEGLGHLVHTRYGWLLLAKLALFLLMLGCAAANRWYLVPRLAVGGDMADKGRAVRQTRISLLLEFSAAMAILALVALLGTLDPLDPS